MRLGVFAAGLIFLIGASVPATAQSPATIPLVTGSNYFPYTHESLPEGGLTTMIVRRVFERMGYQTQIDFKSWDDGFREAAAAKYAATFPYVKNPQREEEFLYSAKLFTVRPLLFVNFQEALFINSIDDIQGRILCVPKGWAIDPYLRKAVSHAKARIYNGTTVLGCFQLLHQRQVDAISIDRRLGMSAASAVAEGPWYKPKQLSPRGIGNYMIVSKSVQGGDRMIRLFNEALAELQDEGVIEEITEAYYAQYQ